jgi:hypothetical protein
MKIRDFIVFVGLAVFLVSCASKMTIKEHKPLTVTKKGTFLVKQDKLEASLEVTGEWHIQRPDDAKKKLVVAPRIVHETNGTSSFSTFALDPGNYTKIPSLSFDKLYLSLKDELWGIPFEWRLGIDRYTKSEKWWDFMDNPNENNAWVAIKSPFEMYPRSTFGSQLNLSLSETIDFQITTKQYLPSIIPADDEHISRPKELKESLHLLADDFPKKFNFDAQLSHEGKFMKTELFGSIGKSPWPRDAKVNDPFYSPEGFKFYSIGANFEKTWKNWTFSVKPNFKWGDEVDHKIFVSTSVKKDWKFDDKIFEFGLSHLTAETTNEEKQTRDQRWWDYRNALGCSISTYGYLTFVPEKLTLGLNVTSNYEEWSYMFIPEAKKAIGDKTEIGLRGYFYWDKDQQSIFERYEDETKVEAWLTHKFDLSGILENVYKKMFKRKK